MRHLKTYALFEKLTEKLYHFTQHLALMNMLKDNEINLTLAIGSSSDFNVNKKKFNFLSMQTTRNSGYGKRRELPVMLVMDGDRLNHNFKGGPVDYWQASGGHQHKHDVDEFEERVFSDKSEIPFKDYVSEIHFLLKPNNFAKPNSEQYQEMMRLASFCKKAADEIGVPIYFYDDKVAYFNNAKQRAVELEDVEGDPEPYDYDKRAYGQYNILSVIVGDDEQAMKDMAARVVFNGFHKGMAEKYANDKKLAEKEIAQMFKEFSDRWMLKHAAEWAKNNDGVSPYDYKIMDMYRSVEADIHNARSTRNKFMKWTFDVLKKEMHRTGSTTFKDYIEKKYGKFR